jgi:hypothetical protein
MKSLDQKLGRIHAGTATRKDFIIADAKDADMAFGVAAPGPNRSGEAAFKTLDDYLEQIRAVVQQELVDIMLLSASNLERLGIEEGVFKDSPVTPAARANDTTDVWVARHSAYAAEPSRHFRTALLDHIKYGKQVADHSQPHAGADLGLYSITFTNNLDTDYAALEAFRAFRIEAEQKQFRYFLEVFNPNVDPGFPTEQVGDFVNDNILRCLAGVPKAGRPTFLKIPYNGPRALEELVAYDASLVVGILGGGAGTTLDAFQLIHDAQKYGAKVALFGRKINLSEHPLAFIKCLRAITNGDLKPEEAVRAYHSDLQTAGIAALRSLEDDLLITESALSYS